MFLILDNFEHLHVAAPAVADLLATTARLSLLVTSRSPLRIRWERVFPVAPLQPERAERLFRERSVQAAPDVPLDDADVVAAICRRLDCLPLAIELAAARTALLPPPALLARLGQAMTVLTGGARGLPDRQQTLHHALTWSYDLLGRDEQAFFRHLAVFADGWTLDAAAEVAGVDDAAAIQLHATLLDNSLIVREEQASEPRFGMLQTVWSYAAERLAAGEEQETARDRHAAYYRELAIAAGAQSWGPEHAGWLDRLEDEKDNIRLAMLRLLGNRDLDNVASIAFALWPFWWIRGHHAEALGWVDRALEHGSLASAGDRARLLFVAGSLRVASGRNDELAAQLDQSIRLAREAADQHTLGVALTQRGFAAVFAGQPDIASRMLDEADLVTRSQGDRHAQAFAAVARAHTLIAVGQVSAADGLLAARESEIRSLGAH